MSCLKCSGPIVNDSYCECDGCGHKIHHVCADLTASEVKINALEARFGELEKQIASKNPEANITIQTAPTGDANYDALFSEVEDRKRRANNLIIHNLPKAEIDNPNQDKTIVCNILNNISLADSVRKVIRIGKSTNNHYSAKVILNDSSSVLHALRNKNKINDPNIKLASDLTPNQRDHLQHLRKTLEDRHQADNIEQVFISVKSKSKKIIVGSIYLPPKSDATLYESHSNSVDHILATHPEHELYLFGDYNLPTARWSNDEMGVCVESDINCASHALCETFAFHNLFQINNIPNCHNTLLDLIFTNNR
ncbi:hypothetical protein JTB14_028341 [Gonioctena quinquepunctata]|nr:hypothetical protein JTB14_028341 [Gonioctena quinquepunctata]